VIAKGVKAVIKGAIKAAIKAVSKAATKVARVGRAAKVDSPSTAAARWPRPWQRRCSSADKRVD